MDVPGQITLTPVIDEGWLDGWTARIWFSDDNWTCVGPRQTPEKALAAIKDTMFEQSIEERINA